MYETIFSYCGMLAMAGWLALVALPRSQFVVCVLTRLIIPTLIAVVYLYLMATHFGQAPENVGFDSLASVQALFTVEGMLLAGWIHYLAFDLFVGSWEVEDAQEKGVPHLVVLPCLFATLMVGPGGLALYLLLRAGFTAVGGQRNEVAST